MDHQEEADAGDQEGYRCQVKFNTIVIGEVKMKEVYKKDWNTGALGLCLTISSTIFPTTNRMLLVNVRQFTIKNTFVFFSLSISYTHLPLILVH